MRSGFRDLAQERYKQIAEPFEWKFTKQDLARLLSKLATMPSGPSEPGRRSRRGCGTKRREASVRNVSVAGPRVDVACSRVGDVLKAEIVNREDRKVLACHSTNCVDVQPGGRKTLEVG